MQQCKHHHIIVSIPDQSLGWYISGVLEKEYPISTSGYGLGTEPGSFRTPLGNFVIRDKIGSGCERGTIFRSREAVGIWKPGDPEGEDMVLTRILRLDGVDEANSNTYDRYIYVHATNHESKIGQAAGHGCVRMTSEGIEDLFERVDVGVSLQILDSRLPSSINGL